MRDKDGNVWFSDFQSPILSELNVKTGKVTEYKIPLAKPLEKGFPAGGLQIAIDDQGDVWEGTMGQSQVVRLDPKTGKMTIWNAPDSQTVPDMRLTFVDPFHQRVDGKVWLSEAGLPEGNTMFQLDTKTGVFTRVQHPKDSPLSAPYDVISNSHNDAYGMNQRNDYIWRVDAKTLKTTFFKIPVLGAGGRRGHIDSQDRLWWGQYYGNSYAMFDPKTGKISEWKAPTPYDDPYDAQFDDKTYLWGGGMDSDRVQRLNVSTGRFSEYLLPQQTNIRRVDVDRSTPLSSVWIGDQQNARIVHVEPLAP
jgi:virginiamycin B lyase